jgi:spore coat protein SA
MAASPAIDPRINESLRIRAEKLSVAVLLSGREKFSPFFGGALARWTHEIYSQLSGQVQATVFGFPTAAEDCYSTPHETSHAWRVCRVASKIPFARRYEDHLWLRALLPRLRRFDFVHIHNRPQWVRILRHIGYEGKIVLHLQNDHLGHWTTEMLDESAPQLDAVVTCSEYLKNTFAPKSSAIARKAHVIYNGVNTKLFYPREDMREPQTILFVGRFDPEKGILELIQAYARVLQQHPETRLVIAGTTGFGQHAPNDYVREVESLADSIARKQLANILFTGYLHHDRDLPGWFQRATVFASPSIFQEPFGLVNAEAMACATPVVGSNRGGIPEALGDAGLLIDPENLEQFADCLSRILRDREYATKLARAGYERCRQQFDWQVIARHWNSLLSELA